MRTYFLGDFDAEWGRILIYSTERQVEIGKKEVAVSIKDNSNILYRLILNTYLRVISFLSVCLFSGNIHLIAVLGRVRKLG